MEFDRWTVLLLRRTENAPALSDAERDRVQDEHLAYLSKRHTDGTLVAAGPVESTGPRKIVGICIYRVGVDEARALGEQDPAVRAGQLSAEVFSWSVPQGSFTPGSARFPRSMAEATGRDEG